MAEGQIKSGQSKRRAERGQKAGQGMFNMNKQLCRAGPKRTARKNWVKIKFLGLYFGTFVADYHINVQV